MPIEIHQLDIVPDPAGAESGAVGGGAAGAGTTPAPAAATLPSAAALRDWHRELAAQAARLTAD